MADFEIAGKYYRSSKMNAFTQFHVARKLGPILAKIGPSAMANGANTAEPNMYNLLEPAMDALAQMPEADCDFILHRCLSVVQRKITDSSWMNVWNEQAKRLQYEDIDLAAMIQIAMNVLSDNLGNFISAPASTTLKPSLPGSDTQGNS